jgi:superoxide reductase
MLAPMERRHFLRGSVLAAVAPALAAATWPARAAAQRGHRRPGPNPASACPPARAEWSATGPPQGRTPGDPAALTAEERVHAPVLTLPERVRAGRSFDLVVQVGVRPHEISPEHHIEWIEVCVGERRVLVSDLSIDVAFPVLRVPLILHGPALLSARARCNLHGVWITRREIAVT